LVQISKDPIGTKGARLTSHISIPGRHLVFMPTVDHVGISRRISNERERRRLREIVDRLRPPGTGFIVRTVAENVPQEKLESDIRFLIEVWNECVRRNEKMNGPGLLHPDLDLILRATRDLFARDVEKLVVDDRDEYERILAFVSAQDSALRDRVLYHDDEEPIFDAYGIEQELGRAVQRKVWLKSGGYLVIDQAEALTAIDVNSGRYVGKKSLEETITKINIEAAKEIVYQLRLRNIGGIIICDFIDMEKASNRDKVFKTLQEALGRDKAKTNVLRISELDPKARAGVDWTNPPRRLRLLRRTRLCEDGDHRRLPDLSRNPARGPQLQGARVGNQLQHGRGEASARRRAPRTAPLDGSVQQVHPSQGAAELSPRAIRHLRQTWSGDGFTSSQWPPARRRDGFFLSGRRKRTPTRTGQRWRITRGRPTQACVGDQGGLVLC
jgi:hypothetical protein